ncbi:MAG: PQQ-binding-like beta-propeller repeat protein [Bdellovibrio sp.]|nr:PQQ-binding-like beta-propeller repeat protein [Bdellovibrio sp.]
MNRRFFEKKQIRESAMIMMMTAEYPRWSYTVLGLCLILFCSCAGLKGAFAPREKMLISNPFAKIAWIKNQDPNYESGNLPIALNSPLIHQDMVFVGKNTGGMEALELKNGRVVWRTQDIGAFHGAPQVMDDLLIYGTTEGRVFARAWATGELQYEVDLGATIESQATIHNGRALFHLRNHKIVCVDARTGKILWAYQRSVPYLNTLQGVSKPIVHGKRVFVGMADGNIVALGLNDGTVIWERKLTTASKFVDIDAEALVVNDTLVIGPKSGLLYVINPNAGQIIRTFEYGLAHVPVAENGVILVPTTDGQIVKFDSSWKEIQKIKISESSLSSLKIWKGYLVVSDVKGQIYLVDRDLKQILRTHQFGHSYSAIFGELEVKGDYLLVLSSRNRLYAFNWPGTGVLGL